MKRFLALGGLLPFLILGILSLFAQAQEIATVLKVTDGDTLRVSYQGRAERIRLIGIDAPEVSANQKAKKDAERSRMDVQTIKAMGKRATVYVKTLVKPGARVELEFDVQVRDQYGRLLAYVYLQDGRMLNEIIVQAGYASLLTYPPNVKYQERFLKAYQQAREKGLGLWASPQVVPQSQQSEEVTVYITRTGKKYHTAGCRSLSKSMIPISLKDAKRRGYEPCSLCRPPQ